MKELTGNQVRQMFLDFFRSKNHMIEPGASLIPVNDPTLLWINAGVAALKKYLDGSEKPACNRIANAQKCIRTNDIENVGKTSRHHTFFEMLGNWSIGDYFKEESLKMSWEFLTSPEWIGFDPDRLYVTIYPDDEESYKIWTEEIGLNPKHILKSYDNFWEIGEGPCGPDSEIYYDRGEEYDPEGIGEELFFKEMENDRYIEIWNNVFSQYNSEAGVDRKDYKELPQKNIDTGMGLERLVSIIQNGETNFDTDLFLPIIHATEAIAKVPYAQDKMAYRVIADHIRTVTFALADGAAFDNAGRGYVLRRILRRAVRYGKRIGIEGSFMYNLVPVVSDMMKEFYDYLPSKVAYVQKMVKIEEERFHSTLNGGEKMLADIIAKMDGKVLDGQTAFKLFDTYGFPFELTVEIAEENGLTVDEAEFRKQMEMQRQRARDARNADESMSAQKIDLMNFEEASSFTYDPTPIQGKVIGLFEDGVKVDKITKAGEIVLDQTTFYAEMGGQVADLGTMNGESASLKVVNVLKAPHGQALHYVEVVEGEVELGDVFTLNIDMQRRNQIQNNHTATHLLQRALKNVLGDHVNQAGSYVDAERLRFDFTHYEKVSAENLAKIEAIVNAKIFEAMPVNISYMDKDEAIASGAMALFNEKYGDRVRVVNAGDWSVELCGGCHVANTSAIGLFKIVSEESVGSGIRRIEAVTAMAAYNALNQSVQTLDEVANALKVKNKAEIVEKAVALNNELNAVKKENEKLKSKLNALEAAEKLKNVQEVNGKKFFVVYENGLANPEAKSLTLEYANQLQSGVVVLVNAEEGKATYFVAVSKDLNGQGIKAGDLVKAACAASNGRGGGKPDFAQGGTKEPQLVEKGLEAIKQAL